MPKLVLPLQDTPESVTRPIIFDITRQLFKITGISSDTRIFYPGYMERDRQPGSTVRDSEVINTFGAGQKITIDVEENYEQDRILSSAVLRPENLFIFRDDRIETSIKPAYSSTEITINFRHRAIDRISALRWRDDIKTRISMMRDEHLHDLTYHYLIPAEFMIIMREIHRLRENVAGYGQDFETFFRENLTQRASLLSNFSGTHQEWGISEKQMRVIGWFEFEGAPEQGSREDEDDTWTIAFSYKFRYDKPIACVMQYPLVIHNQLLSSRYRPTESAYQVEHHLRSYSHSARNFAVFEKTRETAALSMQPGVSIPEFDEFIPASVLASTKRILTTLVTVDPADPRLLLNLNDLGKTWSLNPVILELLKQEHADLGTDYGTIFGLQLYRGIDRLPSGTLSVDADLNVRSTIDLSLRQYYHVRLSLLTDMSALPQHVWDRLRENGPALSIILAAVNPNVSTLLPAPNLLGGKYMPRDYLSKAIDIIDRARLSKSDQQIRQFNTVMTLFVQANMRE